jgi:ubiquinone/menaquinone biosynthesis C-methylase UbiE
VKKTSPVSRESHVCPWWLIRTFDNPVRRLFQNPERILQGIVCPGDACLDIGCGIGYFTIPMARLVGSSGSVTAVDVQPQMLAGVKRRAQKSGLFDRIRLHQADASGLHLEGAFNFALVFWMAHEVPDQPSLFQQIYIALKSGGQMMLVEPKGHVKQAAFERTVGIAEQAGLVTASSLSVPFSRAVLMANIDRSAA